MSLVPLLTAPALAQQTVVGFTAAQADRGEDAYAEYCGGCHGATLGGEGEAPALGGDAFGARWFTGPADAFFVFISEAMPQQAPGTLEPGEYADITAYIMQRNGFVAGETEFPADAAALATLTYPPLP